MVEVAEGDARDADALPAPFFLGIIAGHHLHARQDPGPLLAEGRVGIRHGFGDVAVRLADSPGGTTLQYDVDAAVGGKLAQIGARLIEGTARKLAEEFFTAFTRIAASMAASPASLRP